MGEGLRWQAPGWDVFPGDKVCSELDFRSLPLAREWVWGRGEGHIEGLLHCSQERQCEGGGQEMMEVTDADGLLLSKAPWMILTGH